MKRERPPDELLEHWTILPGEWPLVGNKSGPTRLGDAVLLKFFQYEGRFPRHPQRLSAATQQHLETLLVPAEAPASSPASQPEPDRAVLHELRDELAALDRALPGNPDVEILPKAGGWIKLSPLDPQPEPVNLVALKTEIARRWPMTRLLDILKETDVRVGFTRVFRSPTAWETLDRDTLPYRLLLALYGLGTGAGLKRVPLGNPGVAYRDLLYVRRRFITKDALRQAIAEVVNRLFNVRLPQIWGEGTTACASDSRHFRTWDQNLMTEWHVR